uniref:Endoplasmic reticulum transmembrane protein n=1 Tax=Strongyloides stercoralis TaxID=6248 RepID=A0A0K0E537_STRER
MILQRMEMLKISKHKKKIKMSIQWTIVAGILYTEIVFVILLVLPWIRPTIWKKFFNSRVITAISHKSTIASYSTIFVLTLLFLDAARECAKYSNTTLIENSLLKGAADVDTAIHMRLFRSQRNLYISGFALLLFLVINRIVGLLVRSAQLQASAEAAMKQAESATKTAKTLMDSEDKDESASKILELEKELEKVKKDRDAMKEQAENLSKEYERVSDLLTKFENGDDFFFNFYLQLLRSSLVIELYRGLIFSFEDGKCF